MQNLWRRFRGAIGGDTTWRSLCDVHPGTVAFSCDLTHASLRCRTLCGVIGRLAAALKIFTLTCESNQPQIIKSGVSIQFTTAPAPSSRTSRPTPPPIFSISPLQPPHHGRIPVDVLNAVFDHHPAAYSPSALSSSDPAPLWSDRQATADLNSMLLRLMRALPPPRRIVP